MVVVDEDRKVFNILGPMTDDTDLNHKVCICQESGRSVRCFSEDAQQSREKIIESIKAQFRYKYTNETITT